MTTLHTEKLKAKYADEIKGKIYKSPELATKVDPLTEQKILDAESDRDLKKKYARWFILILAVQLIVMNFIFTLVGFKVIEFSEWTLNLYMSGTLIEVFGVIFVITNNLFPKKA